MSAAQACASLPAHRIDFIDEHDAGRVFLGLFEQIPHTGRAHTDEHFHKIRTADAEERHSGLTGHRTGQQGFAGARRSVKQHALGDLGTNGNKLVRTFKEIHNFLEFFLDLIYPCHIGKGHLFLFVPLKLGPAFAELHDLAAAALGLLQHEEHQHQDQDDGQETAQQRQPPWRFRRRILKEGDLLRFQYIGEFCIIRRSGDLKLLPGHQLAGDVLNVSVRADTDRRHLVFLQSLHKGIVISTKRVCGLLRRLESVDCRHNQ